VHDFNECGSQSRLAMTVGPPQFWMESVWRFTCRSTQLYREFRRAIVVSTVHSRMAF
jgi:hypothetical protein